MSLGTDADPTTPYTRAIADTHATLRGRARTLRATGLVTLVLVATGLVVMAMHRVTTGIALLAALPVLGTVWLLIDATWVRRWQQRRLDAWCAGEIEPGAFAHAMSADGRLPAGSIGTMLALLPDRAVSSALGGAPAAARNATARAFASRAIEAQHRAALQSLGAVPKPPRWGHLEVAKVPKPTPPSPSDTSEKCLDLLTLRKEIREMARFLLRCA